MRRPVCLVTSILVPVLLLTTLPVNAYNQGRTDAHALIVQQALAILRNDGFGDIADAIDADDDSGVIDENLAAILLGIQAADDQFGRISLELLTDDTANWNAAGNTHYYNPAAHHAQTGLKIGVLHGTDASIYTFYGSGIAVLTDMVPGRGDANRVFALRGPQPSADRLADWYYALAVQEMRNGQTFDAYFNLGKALHMVQDATVPHHASDHYGVLDLHQAYENGADTYMEREVYLATTAYPDDPAQSLYFPDLPVSAYVHGAALRSREWIGEITQWWGLAHTESSYAPAFAALLPLAQQMTAGILHKFHQSWPTEPYTTIRLTVHRAKALDGPDGWAADLFTSLNVIEPGESASRYSYDFSTDDFVSGYFGDEDEVWPGSYLGYDVWAFCYTSDTVRIAEEVEMVLALWDDDDIDGWTHSVSGSPAGLYNPDWIDINPGDGYRLHLKAQLRTGQVSRWTGREWQIIGRTGEAITSVGNQSGKDLAHGGRGEIEFTIDSIYIPPQVSQPPQTPRNRFPGTIERMVTGVTVTPTLYATSYLDLDGDPQRDSEWKILDASDSIVFRGYGGATCLQEITTPLEPDTLYKWQVRYRDIDEVWSEWSRATLFMTDRPPQKPVNQSPANGATGQPIGPVLVASAYSDPEGNPQLASEWEVDLPQTVLGRPVFLNIYRRLSEGEGNSHRVDEDLAADTTYVWRARYQDVAGVWSEWSDHTAFTTGVAIATLPPTVTIMPTLKVLAPDGGENLLIGSKDLVEWATTGTSIVSVDLDYTTNLGNTWIPIAEGVSSTGTYMWIVPPTISKGCLVRISGLDGEGRVLATDQSDSSFSIYAPVVTGVAITSPKTSEVWRMGTAHEIGWTTTGQDIAYINIYYSTDGGKSFRTVAEKLKNKGSYNWTVPQTPSQMALVRVFAVSAKGENLAMGDSGLFLISPQ